MYVRVPWGSTDVRTRCAVTGNTHTSTRRHRSAEHHEQTCNARRTQDASCIAYASCTIAIGRMIPIRRHSVGLAPTCQVTADSGLLPVRRGGVQPALLLVPLDEFAGTHTLASTRTLTALHRSVGTHTTHMHRLGAGRRPDLDTLDSAHTSCRKCWYVFLRAFCQSGRFTLTRALTHGLLLLTSCTARTHTVHTVHMVSPRAFTVHTSTGLRVTHTHCMRTTRWLRGQTRSLQQCYEYTHVRR
jgi:hypothetical protein